MQIRFTNGKSEQLTWHEMQRMFQHPKSIALILAALFVFMVIKPHAVVVPDLPLHQMSILWANSIIAFYVLYSMAFWVGSRFNLSMPSVAILAVISAYQTISGALLVQVMGHPPVSWITVAELVIFHLFVLSILDVIFAAFIMPKLLPEIRKSEGLPEDMPSVSTGTIPDLPANAVLLGQKFALDDLRLISAQEHYVEIVTASGRQLLRGRISDVEAQLPVEIGMRVHRSHWVAAPAVAGMRRGATWELVLTDETVVPIARARRDTVRAWVEGLGRTVI